jgi:mRNA interferase MazF
VIKQGDIIRVGLDPTKGHEQKGFRPVVVVSNNTYNRKTTFRVVYPISNTEREFALYVALDKRTKTTGKILADQLRTIDICAREHQFVERLPDDILESVLEIAAATVEHG